MRKADKKFCVNSCFWMWWNCLLALILLTWSNFKFLWQFSIILMHKQDKMPVLCCCTLHLQLCYKWLFSACSSLAESPPPSSSLCQIVAPLSPLLTNDTFNNLVILWLWWWGCGDRRNFKAFSLVTPSFLIKFNQGDHIFHILASLHWVFAAKYNFKKFSSHI